MMTKIKEFYVSYISNLERYDSVLSPWEWSKILEIQKLLATVEFLFYIEEKQ